MEKLPDLLREGLDIVFVGTAAGRYAAAVGAYYAHPGNRFWRTLSDIGLTPREYKPHEFRNLLELGIGFTDLSKIGSGMDHEIAPHQFDLARFETNMRHFQPHTIAFTSKKAASVWMSEPTHRILVGRQDKRLPDFPDVFVLPSPSGAAARHWDVKPWRDLAEWVGSDKSH